MLIGAVSSSFFFIVGSMYYLLFKYGEIRRFAIDDIIVLGLGIALSFGLAAWAQLKQNGAHIAELESLLSDIDDDCLNPNRLLRYHKNRRRNVVAISLLLLTGLALFLIFLFFV